MICPHCSSPRGKRHGTTPTGDPCPLAGRRSGPSGKHTTPRAAIPAATADACVELGAALGVHWHDAPREALRRLQEK